VSPGMSDRLNSERHRTFVGRVAERELFRSALASDESPFSVLYVFGPGGVGEDEFAARVLWDLRRDGHRGGLRGCAQPRPFPRRPDGGAVFRPGARYRGAPVRRPVQGLGAQGRSDRHLRDPRAARRLDHRDLPAPATREFAACPGEPQPARGGLARRSWLAADHTPVEAAEPEPGRERSVPQEAKRTARSAPRHPRLHARPSASPLPGRRRVRPAAGRQIPARRDAGRDKDATGAVRSAGARPTARRSNRAPWCATRPSPSSVTW
jgi:hypothetical protein